MLNENNKICFLKIMILNLLFFVVEEKLCLKYMVNENNEICILKIILF